MNSTNSEMYQGTNCDGKCVVEMQKKLDVDVITEFFEVVRDFHNDYKVSNELKNMIISESNECIALLKQKTAELCSVIDEVFLNRRNEQSSFYRLCHKLARSGTSEGKCLPSESKCICFSEENLKKYNVDVSADAAIKYTSNIESVMSAIKNLHGDLECTKCHRLFQTGRSGSSCDCQAPSVSSLSKLHEAILDLCHKNNRNWDDSWYLTCLKRDAEYYRNKSIQSPIPSDESVESFEVISPASEKSDEGIKMSQGSSEANASMVIYADHSTSEQVDGSDLSDYVTWNNLCSSTSECVQKISNGETQSKPHNASNITERWLCKAPLKMNDCPPDKADLGKISNPSISINKVIENKCSVTLPEHKMYVKKNDLTPADIVKKSFNQYFDNTNNSKFSTSIIEKNETVDNGTHKESLKNRKETSDAFHKDVQFARIGYPTPLVVLKVSLYDMLNREKNNSKWLRAK